MVAPFELKSMDQLRVDWVTVVEVKDGLTWSVKGYIGKNKGLGTAIRVTLGPVGFDIALELEEL